MRRAQAQALVAEMSIGRTVPLTYGVQLRWFHLFIVVAFTLTPGVALAVDKSIRLIVVGDSLTAGYQLPGDSAFPEVLERALRGKGKDVTVVNASVSGDTASGGAERLDWALGEGADAVIIELGANDMLRGVDPGATERALDDILARLRARHIPILLAGMRAAPGMGSAYVQRFDAIFPEMAKKHGVIFYPFFLDGVVQDPKLNLLDGMHPNRAGVEAIVTRILPSVEDLLAKIVSR